jgi:hypothetical protein
MGKRLADPLVGNKLPRAIVANLCSQQCQLCDDQPKINWEWMANLM